jgi:YD repeat-containing protein
VPDLANGSGVFGNPATIQQPPVIQATFKDAKGQTTTFETDAIGRVTKQIDPLNRTTSIMRDPQGNPLTITRMHAIRVRLCIVPSVRRTPHTRHEPPPSQPKEHSHCIQGSRR